MALAETAELAARLTLKDNFSGPLSRANASLGKFQGGLAKVGKGAGEIGAGLAKAGEKIGIGLAGALTVAAKTSVDFQDAFAGVRKTVEASPAELEALNQQLRDLSTRVPVNFQDLAGIAQEAGALGVATKDVASFTETVARLSAATVGLTTEGASDALGKLGNVLFTSKERANGLSEEYQRLASALIALGNAGASTEGEILETAKRFGAAGRQAGLTADQVVALSSAITSLGVEPEAAGSALSRTFLNLTRNLAAGNDKAKAFAKTAGLPLKQFKELFTADPVQAFKRFVSGLSSLDKYQAALRLKATGLVNTRDINAITLLSHGTDVLTNSLNVSSKAYKENQALLEVSNKRFDTLKAKLSELKNSFFVAAATVGDGFTPAIGRAADKLAAFLRVPANQDALKKLGQDIGKFIDSIDWNAVIKNGQEFVGVVKGAADWAFKLLDALNKLPGEVKTAGLAFLGLNKLSGGLLGQGLSDIASGLIGGLGKGLLGKVPGIGKLTATPVYVVNFPPGIGGLGGLGGGAAAEGAGAAGLGTIVLGVGAAAAVGAALAIPLANAIRIAAGITPEESAAQNSRGQFGPRNGVPTGGVSNQTLGEHANDRTVDAINKANALLGAGITAGHRDTDKLSTALGRGDNTIGRLIRSGASQASKDMAGLIQKLGSVTKSSDVAALAQKLTHEFVDRGLGGIAAGQKLLADLQRQQKAAQERGDTKLARELDVDIRKVEAKLPERAFINKELRTAESILNSTQSSKQQLASLHKIQADLLAHGDRKAASIIAEAIHRKKMSVKVTVNNKIPIKLSVSAREMHNTFTVYKRSGAIVANKV